jgi:hypothetical protein
MTKASVLLNHLSHVECPNITFADDEFPVVLKKGLGMHLWDTEVIGPK